MIMESRLTVVQEIMAGTIHGSNVELTGVNYTFIERGSVDSYYLDNFLLTFVDKENTLNGKGIDEDKLDFKVHLEKVSE